MVIILLLVFLPSIGTAVVGNIRTFNFLFLRQPQLAENETSLLVKMAEDTLRAEGKLPDWLEFTTIDRATCNGYTEEYAYDPVAEAAAVYHATKVDAIVGPECSVGMLKLAHLARIWNIPIMGYRSLDDDLTDRIKFPTLSRVSVSFPSLGGALVDLLHHFKWKQVGIIKDPIPISSGAMRIYRGIIGALRAAGIKINIDLSVEIKNLKSEAAQLFKRLRDNARVIIVVMEFRVEPLFMETLVEHNMTKDGYFYLIPTAPPSGRSGFTNIPSMSEAAKKGFAQSLVISAQGEDAETQKGIMERLLKEQNVTLPDKLPHGLRIDRRNQYGIIHDAFHVIMTVAGELALENKLNHVYDGRLFWKRLPFREFTGASGRVLLNGAADRVPNYLVETVFKNRQKLVFYMDAIGECEDKCNRSGDQITVKSGKINIRWIPQLRWKEMNKYMSIPSDEPTCGFMGEKCDKTKIYLSVGGTLCIVGISTFAFIMYKKKKERDLLRMPWRVAPDAIVKMKKNHSLGSIRSIDSENSKAYIGIEDLVLVHQEMCKYVNYEQLRKIDFSREQLVMFNQIKATQHDNLSSFIGICFNDDKAKKLAILWKTASRGTLEVYFVHYPRLEDQDIIFDTDLQFDAVFQASFTRDILRGMEYLHNSPVKVHGMLDISNCLVTSRWMIKLSNFGLQQVLSDLSAKKEINYIRENWTRLLRMAPELLESGSLEEPTKATQQGDIYSFGIIIYQILYRHDGFEFGQQIETTADEILNNWLQNKHTQQKPKPIFPHQTKIDWESVKILKECWNDDPTKRSTLTQIRDVAKSISSDKGNLVKMMETYAGNLEKLVKERTVLLEDAQRRADALLFQILPRFIATDLKAGKSVEPKIHSSVTLFFSDIVGFTKICADSTPMEIVHFLNELFSHYDAIIEARNAFKIETIGDAYMVVAGLLNPDDNNHSHCYDIAVVTLLMRQATANFKMPHDPEKEMKIRIGIATGTVAAGVIGLNSPKYCLFGDTVNTASRMERTGEAMKIQITEHTKLILDQYADQFVTNERGSISVKGKGMLTTYWLEEGPEFGEKLY